MQKFHSLSLQACHGGPNISSTKTAISLILQSQMHYCKL